MVILSLWFGRRPSRSIVARVSELLKEPPAPGLAGAIVSTADILTDALLGPRLKALRPQLILTFARQSADAARRMSSSHWTSDRGHNVGLDVLHAHDQALGLFRQVLTSRPGPRRPLRDTVAALDAAIERRRELPGDEDGYGLATLRELRRDLARLDHERR
ncbi:MAG: hypothetical protein Q8R45_15450 [Brevundimonas sp.]|uniref:hypothetical protein n=1 Tax=Brevundimonas sp. TaxID=1871086 RepID=UPI002719C6A9|nr:hypothetical protein [Brevundimonas sp.]MDO9586909.1 hypothetical protein [Brevundimonas sp.]MDP3368311.1 hypothetical protein [Brevundimonas sp.]MDP3658349.1 hypothetical protein [Brevundimonas sp.]MDZ4112181.1 hypothetical protein [Brevundimonas sp.]